MKKSIYWCGVSVIMFLIGVCTPYVAYGQQLVPVPEGPQGQPDPCVAFLQRVNQCAAEVSGWQNIIAAKQATLVNAENNLQFWIEMQDLFNLQLTIQTTAPSPGQLQTQQMLIETIQRCKRFIAELKFEITTSQGYLAQWQQLLATSQQMYREAGCH